MVIGMLQAHAWLLALCGPLDHPPHVRHIDHKSLQKSGRASGRASEHNQQAVERGGKTHQEHVLVGRGFIRVVWSHAMHQVKPTAVQGQRSRFIIVPGRICEVVSRSK